ncbi:hypothetical protein [Massilia sp. TSP1-1-2]|uniref:hypothetical protein n=1 Tax=unclassified Massilia TaxID=2609279 RepID=UPI003CE80BAD
MRKSPVHVASGHRLIGVAATIAVHIALALCWLLTSQVRVDADGAPAATIQWIDVRPGAAVAVMPPVARVAPVVHKKTVAPQLTLVTPVLAKPAPASQEAAPGPATVQAPSGKSAYEMMQQARRDIGKIDREIKKEFPEQHIKKPVDTAQSRLEKGIALANELAPPRWYEQAKVKELIDPGQYGRKRYRVVTAYGTYCMTYESAHSPDGRDQATRNSAPKMTICPEHEEPAKAQQW